MKKFFENVGKTVIITIVVGTLVLLAQTGLVLYAFYKGGHPF